MIKLKLKHRTYKIPERFTIKQWDQIVRLDMEDPKSYQIIMAVALNEKVAKFHGVDEDSLILGASLIINEMRKRKKVESKDFTKITIGEFVDLDIWMVKGTEKHMEDILGLLQKEPIKYIDEALWLVDQYANFRISTYRSYAGLFGINDKGEQEDIDPEEWDPNKIAKGWYKVLVDLADNDILRLDPITEQPLYKALTFMSLRKERLLEEQQRQLKQKRKNELSRNRK
tara:strand:- start:1175 stop:1858 length:684 start_codon:yes stop_codon:yes gene_type:complete